MNLGLWRSESFECYLVMVARESGDSPTNCKMMSKGRGKGIERLKEIAKMNVRPPKAMLEELGRSRKEDPREGGKYQLQYVRGVGHQAKREVPGT